VTDLSKRVKTDVHVYRLRLAALPGGVVAFGWDYPGSTLLRVRIVRAPAGDVVAAPAAATGAGVSPAGGTAVGDGAPSAGRPPVDTPPVEPPADGDWRAVYDADTGSFRDRGLPEGSRWRYAVFARDGDELWTLWRDEVVALP
jgi:hypothetical protein